MVEAWTSRQQSHREPRLQPPDRDHLLAAALALGLGACTVSAASRSVCRRRQGHHLRKQPSLPRVRRSSLRRALRAPCAMLAWRRRPPPSSCAARSAIEWARSSGRRGNRVARARAELAEGGRCGAATSQRCRWGTRETPNRIFSLSLTGETLPKLQTYLVQQEHRCRITLGPRTQHTASPAPRCTPSPPSRSPPRWSRTGKCRR